MPDEVRPTLDPDPKGRAGGAFTIAGRVGHWDPIARELTIGARVLRVAASVFLNGDLMAGATVIASGHPSPESPGQWVVTQLRVD